MRCASRAVFWNVLCLLSLPGAVPALHAAEPAEPDPSFEQFAEAMSGVVLEGRFTVLGKDQDPLPRETYEIAGVQKLPRDDYWLFQARIKYADKDVTLPLPLQVKWAGKTPVITLDELKIPALGTFSARVVIDGGKYAGTWTHGDVGGHLFGTIRKKDTPAEPDSPPEE